MACIEAVLIDIDGVRRARRPAPGAHRVLVKTGKYLPRTHRGGSGTPDQVLESFADLPALPGPPG